MMRIMMIVASGLSFLINEAAVKARFGTADKMNFEKPLTQLVWVTSLVSVGMTYLVSTLLIPSNILFEAALSYLGVGVQPPRSTWGGMLSDATQWYQVDPEFILPAGLAIFVTVLAFNLFGDGLRDALDPKSR